MKKPALFPPHQVTWWRLGCALLCLSLTFGCGSADTDLAASLVDTGSTGTFPDDIAGGGLDASLPDIVDGKMGEDVDEDGDVSSAGGGEVSGPVNDASSIADAEPQQDVISSDDIDASAGDPSDTVGEDGNVKPPLDVEQSDATEAEADGGKPFVDADASGSGGSEDDDTVSADGSQGSDSGPEGDSSADDEDTTGPTGDDGSLGADGGTNPSVDGGSTVDDDATDPVEGDSSVGSDASAGVDGADDPAGDGGPSGQSDAMDPSEDGGEATQDGGAGPAPDGGEPGCESDSDCPQPDSDECGEASCVNGVCDLFWEPTGHVCAPPLADEPQGDPVCVAGACDGMGSCELVILEGNPCDDGDACTSESSCDAEGLCEGGKPTICLSDNPCAFATCDPQFGCAQIDAIDGLFCNDDDPCTSETTCLDGQCQGGDNLCDCLVDEDCYDDGNDCNGVTICVDLLGGGKGCQLDPSSVVTCEDSDDPCFANLCDPSQGQCVSEPLAGSPCDDGQACTLGDVCDDVGSCQGAPIVCNDAIPCTVDTCDPTTGQCVFSSNDGAACDDGDPCTKNDECADALCGGEALSCDDDNPCTVDACDPLTGACVSSSIEALDCDDGTVCTEGDQCTGGQCVGQAVECDDGNPCTDDVCDSVLGCVNTPNAAPCDDGSLCTVDDVCGEGQCSGTPLECDDGVACTVDSCDPEVGCVRAADDALCVDDNVCTQAVCDLADGCLFVPVEEPCDDGDACTFSDQCIGGLCVAVPVSCDDGLDCTLDGCDPETGGCIHEAQDQLCDDDNPCTANSCQIDEGCVSIPNDDLACDDGEVCTEGDLCGGGLCVPGDNICPCEVDSDCDNDDLCDGQFICEQEASGLTQCVLSAPPVVCAPSDDPCIQNACDAATGDCGLVAVADGSPCSDDDACTIDEQCAQGVCIAQGLDCVDDIECTIDSCDPLQGCVHVPAPGACDDDLECTIDSCSLIEGCIYVPDDSLCADEVACTVDSCEVGQGCVWAPNDAACSDNTPCTVDICYDTGCANEPEDALCNDDNPCTEDSCQDWGCLNQFGPGDCEDGDLCTLGDTCAFGDCKPGQPKLCDDGNDCTQDLCDSATGGCAAAPVADNTICEDGDACTILDRCQDGSCTTGLDEVCDDAIDCTKDSCDSEVGCQFEGDDTLCDDGNPCTTDVCIVGQGCVHEPSAEFTPCDDAIAATGPDICLQGLCRGFKATEATTPSLWCKLQDAAIVSVDDLDGNVYAVMNYRLGGLFCGATTCPSDDGGFAYCQSRVIRLEGVEAPATIATVGGTLTDLSHDAVVGAEGQIGQIAYNGSVVVWGFSELAQEVAASGQNGGEWTAVWADRVDDESALYFLAGRSGLTDAAKLVQCDLGVGEDCDLISLTDTNWSTSKPVDIDGTLVDGALVGMSVATNLNEYGGAVLSPTTDGGLASEIFDQVPAIHRTLHQADGTLWVTGDAGLLAFSQDGTWSEVELPIESPEALTLTGLATVSGHMVIVGHRQTAGGQEALMLSFPLTSDDQWTEVSLGDGCMALDVHAVGDGLYVVGRCGDGEDTRATSWFMPLF